MRCRARQAEVMFGSSDSAMAVIGLVAVGFLACEFMLYVLFQWTRETIRKRRAEHFGDDGGEAGSHGASWLNRHGDEPLGRPLQYQATQSGKYLQSNSDISPHSVRIFSMRQRPHLR